MATGRTGDRSRGQCGASALVVQDWLGGDLLVADMTVDGERRGVHYWNRMPDGAELDLTRGQLVEGECVLEPRVVHRPPGPPARGVEAYELLATRVAAILAAGDTT